MLMRALVFFVVSLVSGAVGAMVGSVLLPRYFPRPIVSESFELVDKVGKTLAKLTSDAGSDSPRHLGPTLSLFDTLGRERAVLGVSGERAFFILKGNNPGDYISLIPEPFPYSFLIKCGKGELIVDVSNGVIHLVDRSTGTVVHGVRIDFKNGKGLAVIEQGKPIPTIRKPEP
jgi:hypothetical protein